MKQFFQDPKFVRQVIGSPRFICIFFAVWAAVVLVSGIRYGDLSGYDDAAYAHEAKVMIEKGDRWTLSLNGYPDFDKPPLFIWLLAISFKLFGVSDFAAKLPGVILGWATILLIYFLVKELFRDETDEDRRSIGALAMFSLATTQYFLKYASHAMTDVPFTFFFILAIYFYLRGLRNKFFLLASGVAAGCAMMIRSPMVFFPLVIIGLHIIYLRRFKTFVSPAFFGLLFLAFVIPAGWYLIEYQAFGETFFNRHFFNFLAHSSATVERTAGQRFLWYFEYIFLVLRLYLPWCPLMLYGLFLSIRKLRENRAPAEALLLIWLLVVLIPFSLAESKVLRYILPVFPAFAIYVGLALKKSLSPKVMSFFLRGGVALLALAAIYIVLFPNFKTRAEDMRILAPYSDEAAAPGDRIILYTSGESQANFQTQLIWYGRHNCRLIQDLKVIDSLFNEKKYLVVIMDKPTFAGFISPPGSNLTVLKESENFICFQLK